MNFQLQTIKHFYSQPWQQDVSSSFCNGENGTKVKKFVPSEERGNDEKSPSHIPAPFPRQSFLYFAKSAILSQHKYFKATC